MEVELRFKTEPETTDILDVLAEKVSEHKEEDTYYAYKGDDEHFIIRIRHKKGKSYVTFKATTETDGAWQEWEEEIETPVMLEKVLLAGGFEENVKVVKHRVQYTYDDLEINVDTVEGLGKFTEIEAIGDDVEALQKKIITFANEKLNIPKEDLVKYGYPHLMRHGYTKHY